MSSKRVAQIFKILFETGNINNFVFRGVFFSRYVPLKSSFPDEKNISGEIWDIPYQRSYRKLTWQSIKGKFHHWQKLQVCKNFHNAKLHWQRWWKCAFNSRKCLIFLVSLSSKHAHVLLRGKTKPTDQLFSL